MKHLRKLYRASLLWPLLLLSCTVVLFWRDAFAAPPTNGQTTASPQLIPFQGRLTNQAGAAYDSGQFTVTFNFYNLAVGGSTAWTERHEKVSVINGTINVFLGSINPITNVDFGTTKYLGITIDADSNPATADPEMVPRTMIIPSFAAKQAERSRTMDVVDANGVPVQGQSYGWAAVFNNGNPGTGTMAGSKISANTLGSAQITDGTLQETDLSPSLKADSVIPAGSVMAFAGPVLPPGWLWCDGVEYARTTYPRLYAAIGNTHGTNGSTTFRVPDYRGRFLRGADSGTGRDEDRDTRAAMNSGGNAGNNLGSVQNEAFRSHNHSAASFASANHKHYIPFGSSGSNLYSTEQRFGRRVVAVQGGHAPNGFTAQGTGPKDEAASDTPTETASIPADGGNETRPDNAYVGYIIKL